MKSVKPTPSKSILQALFLYRDGKLFWKKSGNGRNVGDEAGMLTNKGYRRVKIDGLLHMAHRLVWAYHFDSVPEYIDHIDQNKSNNAIGNLRLASKIENGRNILLRKNNTSGIKGVYWATREQKWAAELSINKRPHRLGYFDDIELAELVVTEARNKYHREFANHGY
jgi:hypothetical protein